jgi:hypothetical protein
MAINPGHDQAARLPAPLLTARFKWAAWVIAKQNGQYVADSWCLADWFGQWAVSLDLIAIAAAVFVLDDVSGFSQVSYDAVRAALGDAQDGSDVPQSRVRILRDSQQDAGVIGQEAPAFHSSNISTVF